MFLPTTQFEYRAWPSAGMPHVEAVHHLFGSGIGDIRTDTYIVSEARPDWRMVLRGGTHLEIRARTGTVEPLAAWKTLMRSTFPLGRSDVRMLQKAFPDSGLPDRMSAPVDLLSWLGKSAEISAVSKQIVHFAGRRCSAELTQVNLNGVRFETFCLKARRYDTLMAVLAMIPGPRLPNLDYGAWLQGSVVGIRPSPMAEKTEKVNWPSRWHAAILRLPFSKWFPAIAG